jgi:hypothetical protein
MTKHIKNVVLVHGAFADGSGWEPVANILKNDGYKVSVEGQVKVVRRHTNKELRCEREYRKRRVHRIGKVLHEKICDRKEECRSQ